MSVVGYSTLEVLPSVRNLGKELDRQTTSDLAAAGKRGGQRFGDAAGREASSGFKNRFASGIKGFNPLAGLAIGAGVTALVKGAIDEASSLAESGNKINVIFGDAAETVNRFADSASEGLGQSDLQARNAAASFGVYGKAAGLAGDSLSEFATGLTGLASDLASFYDASVQETIDAIGSGLRGEAEPLRRFGVLLDDASLRTEALAQGLIATTKQALTPQQKVLAAHAVILKQTGVAQGDFARTQDGLANSSRDLSADFADLRAEMGEELLPAAQALVGFMRDDAIPTLRTTGGVAKDAVEGFAALPEPLKATAAAFAAVKVASALGVGGALTAGLSSLRSGVDNVRLRTMLMTDAYTDARRETVLWSTATASKVEPGARRLTASMSALAVATQGAGASMRRGLAGMVSMLGGPWGIAIIGATALAGKFWAEHEKAKAHVEGLTESLDKQTGAITENTKAFIAQALEERGILEMAEELGLSLSDVTNAALGNADAFDRLRAAQEASLRVDPLDSSKMIGGEVTNDIEFVINALQDESDAFEKARQIALRHAAATTESGKATVVAGTMIRNYGQEIQTARTELQKLIDKENERTLNAIQARGDQIALNETFRQAAEEAKEGARTLQEGTAAGDANMRALLDIANQWATSVPKVQNARGAYQEVREEFIKLADQMNGPNGTRRQAELLADELLQVPKVAPIEFQSKGFQETMRQIKEAQAALSREFLFVTGIGRRHNASGVDAFAHGGKVGGRGTGDTRLILADPREWVINPKASAYYGDGLLSALNKMQIPRYAEGGPVAAVPAQSAPAPGLTIDFRGSVIQPQDYRGFMHDMQDRAARAEASNVRFDSVGGN